MGAACGPQQSTGSPVASLPRSPALLGGGRPQVPMAKMPFVCRMVQDAAASDVQLASPPKAKERRACGLRAGSGTR